jgi:hypothetical protein
MKDIKTFLNTRLGLQHWPFRKSGIYLFIAAVILPSIWGLMKIKCFSHNPDSSMLFLLSLVPSMCAILTCRDIQKIPNIYIAAAWGMISLITTTILGYFIFPGYFGVIDSLSLLTIILFILFVPPLFYSFFLWALYSQKEAFAEQAKLSALGNPDDLFFFTDDKDETFWSKWLGLRYFAFGKEGIFLFIAAVVLPSLLIVFNKKFFPKQSSIGDGLGMTLICSMLAFQSCRDIRKFNNIAISAGWGIIFFLSATFLGAFVLPIRFGLIQPMHFNFLMEPVLSLLLLLVLIYVIFWAILHSHKRTLIKQENEKLSRLSQSHE